MAGEKRGLQDTVPMAVDADRRREAVRVGLRRRAFCIAAECELITSELLLSDQRNWSDAFSRVLVSARRLIALTAPGSEEVLTADLRPTERLAAVQSEILATMNPLTAAASSAPGDAAALRGVQIIRELAVGLFTLPDGVAREPDGTKPAAVPAPSLRSRVLIVDDDANVLNLLKRSLESWGLDVTTAQDGREGLAKATAGAFDLVLTDIEMPHMDGVALLTALKSNPATRGIPVIVISSKDDMTSVTTCIDLGAEDHISKPFAPQLLSSRVKASLDRKRLHDTETADLRRVELLIAAAEAVERDAYAPESLTSLRSKPDGLGQLARVFDRMVSGLKTREARLRSRVGRLRAEVRDSRLTAPVSGEIPVDSPFAAGDVIAGRFEIVGQLGQGGMGTVYHARDRELGEDVALKIVRRDLLTDDPLILDRLKSEIRLSRKISHPNVVRAHDIGEWEGRYFITMEKVHGVTVAELLDRRGTLTVESTLAIGTQLCEALAVAHDNEIIHRDVKPANLLIDDAGALKVMDFGIARRLGAGAGHTQDGFLVGTPEYMAPELLLGKKPDVHTDLFAVGVVLYECLTGKLPHEGTNPLELYNAILNAQTTRVGQLVADVPPQFESLIHQQLRYEAAARSPSARDLGQRLSELEHSKSG